MTRIAALPAPAPAPNSPALTADSNPTSFDEALADAVTATEGTTSTASPDETASAPADSAADETVDPAEIDQLLAVLALAIEPVRVPDPAPLPAADTSAAPVVGEALSTVVPPAADLLPAVPAVTAPTTAAPADAPSTAALPIPADQDVATSDVTEQATTPAASPAAAAPAADLPIAPIAPEAHLDVATAPAKGPADASAREQLAVPDAGDSTPAAVARTADPLRVAEVTTAAPATAAPAPAEVALPVEAAGVANAVTVTATPPTTEAAASPADNIQISVLNAAGATRTPEPNPVPTSAPAAPALPAEQVATHVRAAAARLGDGTHQLRLQLRPVELGDVTVDLTVRGDEVAISLRAASGASRDALSAALGDLRSALETAGLRATELSVTTDDRPSASYDPDQGSEGRFYDDADDLPALAARPTPATRTAAPAGTGRLDLHL